jgi:hypothetical protein
MNKFFKTIIGKCILYMLLCVFVFASLILLGFFIAGNTNIFEWHEVSRFVIVVLSIGITVLLFTFNK